MTRTRGAKGARKRKPAPHRTLLIVALTLLALCGGLILSALLKTGTAQKAGQTEFPAGSSTTLWPYGQPEYTVDVPEGYEALLPAEADQKAKGMAEMQTDAAAPLDRPQEPRVKTNDAEGVRNTLIIVIDDIGYNLDQLKPFLELPFPLTVAILPGVAHSSEAAALATQAGKEVILHQPMQALGGNDTGPGAITLDMGKDAIDLVVSSNLASVPGAVGMNNHMGSAVTRDAKIMREVLYIAKERGIYYLDSLTAPATATAQLSGELAMPLWERNVFLDNSGDRQSIINALEEGKKIASSRGASVMIGHVWSSELAQTLMDVYPQLVADGYSLSTISKLMLRSSEESADADPGD